MVYDTMEQNVTVTMLTEDVIGILIDRWATRSQILTQIRRVLRQYCVPARSVDRRIPDALRLRKEECLSYPEASRQVFGHADNAEILRAWNNRIEASK